MSAGPEEVQIGWRVLDPEGNVVDSGPVTIAHMTGELREMLGLPPEGEE